MTDPTTAGPDQRTTPTLSPNLMAVTLARVAEHDRTGAHAGWLAAVRTGLTAAAETPALAATAPFTHHLGDTAARGARAAAAIRAIHRSCAHTDRLSLGASLRLLDRQVGGDQVRQQVAALPVVDVNNAATILAQLVSRASAAGTPVNFHALADTLTYWGSGATRGSKATRSKVVFDFHRHVGAAPTSAT